VVALVQNNNRCTTNPTLSGNDDKITLHSPSRSLNLPLWGGGSKQSKIERISGLIDFVTVKTSCKVCGRSH